MAVWEVRDREIDALIESWLKSRIEHGPIMARYEAAEAGEWKLPEYRAETDLIYYHQFLAERLHYYAGRDVTSADRALAVVRDIALASLPFIKRYGWGYPQLNEVAKTTVELWAADATKPNSESWWNRTFNA